ncbi:pirin family protein [Candidatus Gracilibacteria bacterium]|nr:pirin family protein [Candidatus Gracilibacteria bacterium]
MNIQIIPARSRFTARHDWLESKHLFSFADYYDPANMHFGALRVFNDDIIAGHQGFGMHPHSNMEIITLVLSGEISHEDSHGGRATVGAGGAQVMSAGSGLRHSEINNGDEAVHLYQIWIMPREENITPRHDERDFSDMRRNHLVPIASGFDHDALQIHTDAVIYRGIFDAETSWTHMAHAGTGNVFIYVTKGSVDLATGETLEVGDQARISEVEMLELNFSVGAEVVVIDVA